MGVPAAPVRVPSQRLFDPSVASVTSVANDNGGNKMILGAVHRSPGICLAAQENPKKPHLGDRLMKKFATSHRLKWDTIPPNGVGSHSTSEWEKEGNKEEI